jgi:dTDP-4-dehydrorhamnose reductase
MKVLLFGKNGWIGGMLQTLMTEKGIEFALADARLQNREHVARELDEHKPTHVLDAAGVTGRPNVDWCEDHQIETLRTNVLGTLNLADLCEERGIHCTIYATGCIFHYDEKINRPWPVWDEATRTWSTLPREQQFSEEDVANFGGSFYSHTKGMIEQMLKSYSKVLVLRVRMPISDDLSPRNFVTKISKYEKVVNIPNSMTILTDLLPVSISLAERSKCGIYNFTNPGVISHNQVLDLYAKHIDTTFTYQNFTIEEQAKVIKAERSNNWLDTKKIEDAMKEVGQEIPDIHAGMEQCFIRMRKNLEAAGTLPVGRQS